MARTSGKLRGAQACRGKACRGPDAAFPAATGPMPIHRLDLRTTGPVTMLRGVPVSWQFLMILGAVYQNPKLDKEKP